MSDESQADGADQGVGKEYHAPAVHHEEVEEGESWLISYADMVTLLMGLFVILYAMSDQNKEKIESVKREVSEYFGGQYIVPFKDLKDELSRFVYNKDLGREVDVASTPNGLEVKFKSRFFFDSGSIELKKEALEVLKNLLKTLKDKNKDTWQNLNFVSEGHTDDEPMVGTKFKNNFELSSMRALTVLQVLREQGFKDEQLLAVGYGSTRPLVPPPDINPIGTQDTISNKLKYVNFAKDKNLKPSDLKKMEQEEAQQKNQERDDIYAINRRVVLKISEKGTSLHDRQPQAE